MRMKKITSFMSLLLLFFGATTQADAQAFNSLTTAVDQTQAVTSLTAITEGDYVIYNVGRSRYLKYNAVDGNMSVSADIDVSSIEAGLYVFHIKPKTSDGATTYTIKTAVANYYMPETRLSANSTPVSTTADEAYGFTIEELDATNHRFGIKTSAGIYFNGNPNDFVGWSGNGSNSQLLIIPVTTGEAKAAVVTQNATDYTAAKKYVKAFGTKFSTFFTTTYPKSYYFTFEVKEDKEVSADNYVGDITVTKGQAPVTFGTWYAMNTRGEDGRYVKANDNGDGIIAYYTIGNAANYTDFNKSLWAFEESGLGVKIKNKATGTYLTSSSTLKTSGEATTFYFNTANSGYDFTLCDGKDNTTNYFGNHTGWNAWNGNTTLGYWNNSGAAADAGSQFKIRAVDTDSDLLALGKTCAKNSPNTANETYLTSGTDLTASASAIEAATTMDALDAAYKAALETVVPDTSAYYRLVNCSGTSKKYVTTANVSLDKDGTMLTAYEADTNIDRKLSRVEEGGALVPQLFQFVSSSTSGAYYLRSANLGYRVGITVNSPLDIPSKDEYATTAVTLNSNTTVNTGDEKFIKIQMKFDGSHIINAYGGNSNNILQNYDYPDDAGGFWKIEKITSIPVSIGTTGFTSVCYPFAVQIPDTSSVKAYYGKQLTDGAVLLTEIEDGIIPANQGVVLYNESGETSVNLAITTTENTFANALSGVNARRINYAASSTYGLGKTTAGEVAFMVNTSTAVPANKAYIDNSASNTVSAIRLSFGTVDGIDAATIGDNGAKSVKYFDLNGRPVLYPVHGLYITDKGQKVLFP